MKHDVQQGEAMRFVCVSDTHLRHDIAIPDGDVLLHAGDFTMRGSVAEVARFGTFLAGLPHKHKVVIAGNHDFLFEKEPGLARATLTHCGYLQDSEITIEGVRIYGSPWQPFFFNWAFNLRRGAPIKAKWDMIPAGIDILITHGPPLGQGDLVLRPYGDGERVGCADLLDAVKRITPKYHVFGHIHEGYGVTQAGPTTFVNASICDKDYNPVHPPIIFDL